MSQPPPTTTNDPAMPAESSSTDDDRAAWVRAAVERFEGPLVRYARRLTGDLEIAREVAQDTFLKLWKADRVQIDGRLAEWLYTVCRNRALDVARKERRMTRLSDSRQAFEPGRADGCGDSADSIPDGRGMAAEPDPGDATPDERRGLMRAMERLPDRQQEILRLKFQSGLSYKEIAGVMGLTVGNVGFLIHTSIKALRDVMDVQV